jgi:hypothetical protein
MDMYHFHCFARNRRWGTCGECPIDSEGHKYPEFCKHWLRYDHQQNLDSLVKEYEARRHCDYGQ